MPKVTEVAPPKMAASPAPAPNCTSALEADGSLTVTFRVRDPQVVKRLRARASTMNLDRYLWENILQRAVTDHVY